MFCDVFHKNQARELLKGKRIWFVGSSNMRAIYKDVLWLITHGSLTSQNTFKVKNEPTYLNDKLLSNDTLHNGRNYKETREYKSKDFYLFFHFITRNYQDHFIDLINSITSETAPDIIILNSCLWDLSRWGPDGPQQFRVNVMRTMRFLKSELPAKTRVIWKTTLPVSTSADGAIFVDEIKFIIPMLPWHILEANVYASTCANFFNYDTLDVHHFMRLQGHLRVKDGIHWSPIAVRYLTNAFLTHLCLCWGHKLPGRFTPSERFLSLTTKRPVQETQIEERVNKKAGFFEKLFALSNKDEKKKKGPLSGIQNIAKNIFKRKKKTKNLKIINSCSNVNNFHRNFIANSNAATASNYYPFTNTNYSYNNNNFEYQSPLLRMDYQQQLMQINYQQQLMQINCQHQLMQLNYQYQSPLMHIENDYYGSNNYYSQYRFPSGRR